MGRKIEITDVELVDGCRKWVSKLCASKGGDWCLSIPPDFRRDPDMLFSELIRRYKELAEESRIVYKDPLVRIVLKNHGISIQVGAVYQWMQWPAFASNWVAMRKILDNVKASISDMDHITQQESSFGIQEEG